MEIEHQKLNLMLQKFKVNPYKIYPVLTPHTGYIREFKVKEGDLVKGPSGKWLEKPGTPLFILERERNQKIIRAKISGVVQKLRIDLLDKFVEAEEVVLEIKHPLSQEEIISEILLSTLYIIKAPETARYILSPSLASKLEKQGLGKVKVKKGEEILIMAFMKRETPIYFPEDGNFVLYHIYFTPFQLVERDQPLIGFCLEENLPYLQKIIERIKEEWPNS
uniref:Biotin attachment protein n=1 Tax=Thermodesulfobacterium geofontis TaxID=1295609 RepID=A0A7C4JRB1_9BACT